MPRQHLYHIIEWSVAIAACGWLAWKMVTYDDYAGLWAALQGMGWMEWGALVLCMALMPVNMALEAWRWKTLWNGDASLNGANDGMMSWREAQRQVYYSKLAGLITPWRLGEYPARAVIMNERVNELTNERLWAKVLSMGAVGSATMTAAIVAAGLVAGMISNFRFMIYDFRPSYIAAITFVLILLGVALYFAPRVLKRWAVVSHKLVAISIGQSLVRLVCWCVQLALVLWALGAVTGYGLWVTGPLYFVYYLLVTVTPNVPIAEAGVRGAWAIVVFGTMNAALAGVLLWIINTLLPCVVWFFIKKEKYIKNNSKISKISK